MASRLFSAALLMFMVFAANAQTDIPPDFVLLKGSWRAFSGSSGAIELSIDSLDNPTKGYFTKSGGSCFSVKKEVPIKKTIDGFSFEADLKGGCKMSTFTLIGPDEQKKYRGSFDASTGTSELNLSIVAKK